MGITDIKQCVMVTMEPKEGAFRKGCGDRHNGKRGDAGQRVAMGTGTEVGTACCVEACPLPHVAWGREPRQVGPSRQQRVFNDGHRAGILSQGRKETWKDVVFAFEFLYSQKVIFETEPAFTKCLYYKFMFQWVFTK